MVVMSPRRRTQVPEPHAAEIIKAATALAEASAILKPAVLSAIDAGASVREVAALAGLAPSTVQRWKSETSRESRGD